MDQGEAYILLFTDILVSNLVITMDRELIVHTMKILGNYSKVVAVLTATVGAILANVINYFFGRIVFNFFYRNNKNASNRQHYETYSSFIIRYSVFVLTLSIVPFWGKFIILLAGFTKVSFFRVISISGLLKICYYMFIL